MRSRLEELNEEKVCHSFKKMTVHIHWLGQIMNAKKVRRHMDEASLLNHRYNERMPVKRVVLTRVTVKSPNIVWEFATKYVWIQGEGRTSSFFGSRIATLWR